MLLLPKNVVSASNPLNIRKREEYTPINGEYCGKCPYVWARWWPIGPKRDALKDSANSAVQNSEPDWASDPTSWLLNAGKQVNKHRWCRAQNITEVLPDLRRLGLLQSKKQIPQRAVTIVTQLSIDRIPMLRKQCSLWSHPISAAMYIPLMRGNMFSAEKGSRWHGALLETGMAALAALHADADSDPEGCMLDLEIVSEERCDAAHAMVYPTNALRNRALHLASTDVVLLLDADFVVDRALADTVESPTEYAKIVDILSHQAAFVLPAFETADSGERGVEIATDLVHRGKDSLTAHLIEDKVYPFYACRFPVGHRGTMSHYWAHVMEPYRVSYEVGYEPYLLMLKRFVPYYDERFSGLFRDKVP